MKIEFIEVQNFRKLKSCRIEFSDKKTVFVGANNSGKTSAMDALILFLEKSQRKCVTSTDFTLSNWYGINAIGRTWLTNDNSKPVDVSVSSWESFLPSVDVWIDVKENEIHYVSHLIPTLSWEGGLIGIRLRFEPKNTEELLKEFCTSYRAVQQTITDANGRENCRNLNLWPQSMRDFLDRKLQTYFGVKAYILDPDKLEEPQDGVAKVQKLPEDSIPLDREPFDGLFKIDIINAQRGFSDAKSFDASNPSNWVGGLSTQLRQYFSKHLNPSELPTPDDIDALEAIAVARETFDIKLRESFKPAIQELEGLGYPGFSDPEIILTSKLNPIDTLDHDTAVQFNLMKHNESNEEAQLCLPEKYNGLGYQNLISMVFSLIRFRDEWMRKGKAGKKLEGSDSIIEPLHLVLVEEPEAHLHAQVQQVFIKKAYDVLRNHEQLMNNDKFMTQLIVSTHSSHIAHEIDFASLRYFRRRYAEKVNDVPFVTVVNLSSTFGREDETSKFATRYLQATHCDLFFADAAILVEGPAERMLVPHFIRNKYPELDSRYVTLLEIGGSHAHRLRPLIEQLGILTLVITDIDSIGQNTQKKVLPKRDQKYRSGNDTLKTWIPCKEKLDDLLKATDEEKVSTDSTVRVAYQCAIKILFDDKEQEVLPYTFEDALVLTNVKLFKKVTNANGLLKKMVDALNSKSLDDASLAMFDALENGKKAEMALDILYKEDPTKIDPPQYIANGLVWLEMELERKNVDFILEGTIVGGAK